MYSGAHAPCRFSHTFVHSVVGWFRVILIALGSFSASNIVRSVWYIRRLKALGDSLSLGGLTCAISLAYIRRYSRFFGIRLICGGLTLYASRSQYSFQSAGNVPVSFPWVHILANSRARLFASISHNSNPPSFFPSVMWISAPSRWRPAIGTMLLRT